LLKPWRFNVSKIRAGIQLVSSTLAAHRGTGVLAGVFLGLCAANAGAQETSRPSIGIQSLQRPVGVTPSSSVLAPRWGTISGRALDQQNYPILGAKVRARSLHTGRVDGTDITKAAGRFTFERLDRGNYVMELLDDAGRVKTIGDVVSVTPGIVSTAVVKVPASGTTTGLFSSAAAALTTAAAGAGVTAIRTAGVLGDDAEGDEPPQRMPQFVVPGSTTPLPTSSQQGQSLPGRIGGRVPGQGTSLTIREPLPRRPDTPADQRSNTDQSPVRRPASAER
jgi:hypothetical protein